MCFILFLSTCSDLSRSFAISFRVFPSANACMMSVKLSAFVLVPIFILMIITAVSFKTVPPTSVNNYIFEDKNVHKQGIPVPLLYHRMGLNATEKSPRETLMPLDIICNEISSCPSPACDKASKMVLAVFFCTENLGQFPKFPKENL
jgi:hypothetical protein